MDIQGLNEWAEQIEEQIADIADRVKAYTERTRGIRDEMNDALIQFEEKLIRHKEEMEAVKARPAPPSGTAPPPAPPPLLPLPKGGPPPPPPPLPGANAAKPTYAETQARLKAEAEARKKGETDERKIKEIGDKAVEELKRTGKTSKKVAAAKTIDLEGIKKKAEEMNAKRQEKHKMAEEARQNAITEAQKKGKNESDVAKAGQEAYEQVMFHINKKEVQQADEHLNIIKNELIRRRKATEREDKDDTDETEWMDTKIKMVSSMKYLASILEVDDLLSASVAEWSPDGSSSSESESD